MALPIIYILLDYILVIHDLLLVVIISWLARMIYELADVVKEIQLMVIIYWVLTIAQLVIQFSISYHRLRHPDRYLWGQHVSSMNSEQRSIHHMKWIKSFLIVFNSFICGFTILGYSIHELDHMNPYVFQFFVLLIYELIQASLLLQFFLIVAWCSHCDLNLEFYSQYHFPYNSSGFHVPWYTNVIWFELELQEEEVVEGKQFAFIRMKYTPFSSSSSSSSFSSSSECSICLGGYQQGCKIGKLPCAHQYHEKCIHRWLNTNNKPSCPLCSSIVDQVDST